MKNDKNIEKEKKMLKRNLFDGDEIQVGEQPKGKKWNYPILYDETVGGMLFWQIGFDGQDLVIKHGKIKIDGENMDYGKIIEKKHPIQINNSKRNLIEQSLLEGKKRYMDKYKKGYYKEKKENELKECQPMLANKYNPEKSNIKEFPVSVMPKYDGIRALMTKEGKEVDARSRLNNKFPYLQHIKEECFQLLSLLPEESKVDGELYSFDMDFTVLSSVVKTIKKIHPRHNELCYYIFDIIENEKRTWLERYGLLKDAFEKLGETRYIKLVKQELVDNDKKILDKHKEYVEQGYEGIIIHHCTGEKSKYKPKRSNNLLKYKSFHDKEVIIIGGKASVGTQEGAVVFLVQDENGKKFEVFPRGTVEKKKKWYQNLDSLIGKKLTIRYQELTIHGIPRMAVGIAIRDYE